MKSRIECSGPRHDKEQQRVVAEGDVVMRSPGSQKKQVTGLHGIRLSVDHFGRRSLHKINEFQIFMRMALDRHVAGLPEDHHVKALRNNVIFRKTFDIFAEKGKFVLPEGVQIKRLEIAVRAVSCIQRIETEMMFITVFADLFGICKTHTDRHRLSPCSPQYTEIVGYIQHSIRILFVNLLFREKYRNMHENGLEFLQFWGDAAKMSQFAIYCVMYGSSLYPGFR